MTPMQSRRVGLMIVVILPGQEDVEQLTLQLMQKTGPVAGQK